MRRIISKLNCGRFRGTTGVLLRIAVLVAAICLNILAILWTGDPRMTWIIAFLGVTVTVIVLCVRNEWRQLPVKIHGAWKNPCFFTWLTIVVAIPTLIGVPVALHMFHISANTTGPEEGKPWHEGLAVRVWWQNPPNQEMENGLVDTARTLGVSYERVPSVDHANLRIWFNSWAHSCKWLNTYAFVSLAPNPSSCGGHTADIYLCRFTTPFKDGQLSNRTIIAHEAAHIFAAQSHFGDGLMAEGGGTYAHWFTDEEIQSMRDRVNRFRASLDPECADPPARPKQKSVMQNTTADVHFAGRPCPD